MYSVMREPDKLDRRQFIKTAAAATAVTVTGATTIRSATAADPIYLAVAGPMTGDAAAFGQNAKRGADVAVALINGAGGIGGRQVAYDTFDDMGSPKEAASVARRILDAGKYQAVVGHVNSSCTLAALPVYNEVSMPVFVGASSNPKITESGWDNVVRLVIRDDYGAQQYSAFAVNNLGKKKLGILFGNDDFGRGLRDEVVKAADVLSAKVVAEAGFTPNQDKDFSSVISLFKARGVDAFMLNCNYTEGGLFLGQAKGAGITGIPTVGPDSLLFEEFISLSQGGAEGAYVLSSFDPYATTAKATAYRDNYRKLYSKLPDIVSTYTHDIFFIVKQLVEGGATKENLIASAKSEKFDDAGGHFEFNNKGDVKGRGKYVLLVKDGKFVSTGSSVDETGLERIRK